MFNSKPQKKKKDKECLAFYGFNLDTFFTFTLLGIYYFVPVDEKGPNAKPEELGEAWKEALQTQDWK